jgi:hypothetical protein
VSGFGLGTTWLFHKSVAQREKQIACYVLSLYASCRGQTCSLDAPDGVVSATFRVLANVAVSFLFFLSCTRGCGALFSGTIAVRGRASVTRVGRRVLLNRGVHDAQQSRVCMSDDEDLDAVPFLDC